MRETERNVCIARLLSRGKYPATRKREIEIEIEIEKGGGSLEGLSPNDSRNHWETVSAGVHTHVAIYGRANGTSDNACRLSVDVYIHIPFCLTRNLHVSLSTFAKREVCSFICNYFSKNKTRSPINKCEQIVDNQLPLRTLSLSGFSFYRTCTITVSYRKRQKIEWGGQKYTCIHTMYRTSL